MITFGQLLLAVSIPTVVALLGILLNQSGIHGLRAEVRADTAELRAIFNHFIDRHTNHEGRISTVEERTKKEGK